MKGEKMPEENAVIRPPGASHEDRKYEVLHEITNLLDTLPLHRLESMLNFVRKIASKPGQEVRITIKREPDFLQTFSP